MSEPLGSHTALQGGSSPAVPTPTAMLQDTAKGPEVQENEASASTTWLLAEPVGLPSPPECNVVQSVTSHFHAEILP